MTLGGRGSLTKPFIWVMVWIHQGQLRSMWWQVQLDFETSTFNNYSFGSKSAKPINHALYSPPNPHLLQHPPLSSCSDRWLFGGLGEHNSTAAQKSPTGVLLTGCPLSSVPISPWPSPHLGRCFGRSTGGGQEDTLQCLKLLDHFQLLCFELGCIVSDWKIAIYSSYLGWSNLFNTSIIQNKHQTDRKIWCSFYT